MIRAANARLPRKDFLMTPSPDRPPGSIIALTPTACCCSPATYNRIFRTRQQRSLVSAAASPTLGLLFCQRTPLGASAENPELILLPAVHPEAARGQIFSHIARLRA
jgi:hypothetical protein